MKSGCNSTELGCTLRERLVISFRHVPLWFSIHIQLKYSFPSQSLALTISCPELLTVSLAAGPQSYSTQRDFTIKKAQRGKDLAQVKVKPGWQRTQVAKQTDQRSVYKQQERARLDWSNVYVLVWVCYYKNKWEGEIWSWNFSLNKTSKHQKQSRY